MFRLLFALIVGFVVILGNTDHAYARYASIVVEANTGRILHSTNAETKNYPASLTKIMTLFMTFEALKTGKLKLKQKLPVSRVAEGRSPSKLGLRRGETITVDHAIKALVTKSANDVATVLAEAMGGTERKFAVLMTKRARSLGMKDTSFVLPNSKVSRLRDRYARVEETMSLSEEAATSAYLSADKLPYGGGGLLSTAADYMRFAQMLLDGGQLDGHRILGRKTVDLMLMDHVGDFAEPKLGDEWVGRTENRSGEMHLGLGYGYGGYVVTDVAANDVPGSVGTYSWGGTASTYFFVDRQEQLIGLFLTQLTPSDSYPLRAQFRGLVYQALED